MDDPTLYQNEPLLTAEQVREILAGERVSIFGPPGSAFFNWGRVFIRQTLPIKMLPLPPPNLADRLLFGNPVAPASEEAKEWCRDRGLDEVFAPALWPDDPPAPGSEGGDLPQPPRHGSSGPNVTLDVTLYDPVSDERVVYHDDYPRSRTELIADGVPCIWTEGNFSCDCNRRSFTYRNLHTDTGDDEEPDFGCGEEVVLERVAIHETGEVLFELK